MSGSGAKRRRRIMMGVALAATLYASGGGNNLIRRYTVRGGRLTEGSPLPLPTTNPAGSKINPLPAGIALTPDGHRLLVTNQGANTVSVCDLTGPEPAQQKTITVGTHPNKALSSADGRTLDVADGDSDEISVIDAATAAVTRTISLAPTRVRRSAATPMRWRCPGRGARSTSPTRATTTSPSSTWHRDASPASSRPPGIPPRWSRVSGRWSSPMARAWARGPTTGQATPTRTTPSPPHATSTPVR